MTLWLLLAAITALALILIVRPLLREQQGGASRQVLETAIYRDRLAEVKRDLERGLLSPAEAEAAEVEISRRMLNVTEAKTSATVEAAAVRSRWLAAALVTAILPLGTVILYLVVGSPDEPGHPFLARQAERDAAAQHVGTDMGAAIERLAKRLEQDSDNLEEWTLLARSYTAAGRYQEAVEAYQRALDLSGRRPDLLGVYGETLVAAAGGVVTPDAREVFEEVLVIQPENPGPRFYLGLASAQSGDGRGALEIWLAIEAEAPPGTPWLSALRQNIDRTAAEFGIDPASIAPRRPAPAAAPGPSAEDMAAARSMSGEEQNDMIRSMVARLAERLEQEPGDVEGWLRLAQAYRVLGENEDAAQAVRRAAAAGDTAPPELRARVEQMARDLGVALKPGQGMESGTPDAPPSAATGQ
jgi:cytochrome c-type biogenesis protein CcmH